LRLANKKLVIGPEVYGHAVFTKGAFFSKESTPLEGLFGAHYTHVDAREHGHGVVPSSHASVDTEAKHAATVALEKKTTS